MCQWVGWGEVHSGLREGCLDIADKYDYKPAIWNTFENMGVSSCSFWFMNWVVLAPAMVILVLD